MSDTPPNTPPADELTDEEKARFGKYLNEVLPNHPAVKQTPQSGNPAPSASSAGNGGTPNPPVPAAPNVDIRSAINSALDERDKASQTTKQIDELKAEVAELKKGQRKRGIFNPFSLW